MTLSFSQLINGKPNNFVNKVWTGISEHGLSTISEYQNYRFEFNEKYGKDWDYSDDDVSKIHTIRENKHNRWKVGTMIHFVINNRNKHRFQFAPLLPCLAVQNIIIWHKKGKPVVYVDGIELDPVNLKGLALNDGFASVADFFAYFNKDFKGVIIHWANAKY